MTVEGRRGRGAALGGVGWWRMAGEGAEGGEAIGLKKQENVTLPGGGDAG